MANNQSDSAIMDTGSHLAVGGASLFYQTIGTGPPLILIPGGNGTAILYESLAYALSSRFRVIIYDRRGFHRSPVCRNDKTPTVNATMKTHAKDIAALIAHISPQEPISLFTCSGSAVIGAELLACNPHLINRVILHEPLFISLLPSPLQEETRKTGEYVMKIYKDKGMGPANKNLMPLVHSAADWKRFKTTQTYRRLTSIPANNMIYYFENELPELIDYQVDVAQLAQLREKLVLFRGSDMGPDQSIIPACRLAEALQIPVVTVQGGHSAYMTDVTETAKAITRALIHIPPKI